MGKSQTQPWVEHWHWNNWCRNWYQKPFRGLSGPSKEELSRVIIDRSGDERAEWVIKQDEMRLAKKRRALYSFEQAWPRAQHQLRSLNDPRPFTSSDWEEKEQYPEVREEFQRLFKKFWMEEV